MSVTLYWLDGSSEQVRCTDFVIRDGVLRLVIDRWVTRHIPLTSIREWRADR